MSHWTLPVRASRANSRASRVPTNTLLAPSATPRLTGPQQAITVPTFGSCRHSCVLAFRSYAMMASLLGLVTYIVPSTTIGVFSNEPSLAVPVWNIMRGTRRLTLPVLIWVSVDHRWLQSLPP